MFGSFEITSIRLYTPLRRPGCVQPDQGYFFMNRTQIAINPEIHLDNEGMYMGFTPFLYYAIILNIVLFCKKDTQTRWSLGAYFVSITMLFRQLLGSLSSILLSLENCTLHFNVFMVQDNKLYLIALHIR